MLQEKSEVLDGRAFNDNTFRFNKVFFNLNCPRRMSLQHSGTCPIPAERLQPGTVEGRHAGRVEGQHTWAALGQLRTSIALATAVVEKRAWYN